MLIKDTQFVRIDWIDANSAVLTLEGADGEELRSVPMMSGYCRQGLGDGLYNLLENTKGSK